MNNNPSLHKKLLTFLLEEAPVIYLLFDDKGTIVDFNQWAKELFGDAVSERTFRDIFIDFSENLNLEILARSPHEIHLLNIEIESDTPHTVFFTFSKISGMYIALGKHNIQEYFHLQKELLSMNNEMNNLTRQLQKQNIELEKFNQLKNQFLGMAAHDLRKPTGLIMSYSEFLIDEISDDLDEEHKKFLDIIHSASESMKKMIDDFLDVSIIESGFFELDLQPVQIDELFLTTIPLLKQIAQKKNITIDLQTASQIPTVLLDKAKIEQIIINLVSNAIEYSPAGSPVTINVFPDDRYVFFKVTDQGVGIPEEEIDRLFIPFGKGKTKKTSGEKSVGLGLAISRKIVEQHNGAISVKSETGKGSVFKFSIPIQG